MLRDGHQKKPCRLGTGKVERLLTEKVKVVELARKLDTHGGHIVCTALFLHSAQAVKSPERAAVQCASKGGNIAALMDCAAQQEAKKAFFF